MAAPGELLLRHACLISIIEKKKNGEGWKMVEFKMKFQKVFELNMCVHISHEIASKIFFQ